MLWYLAHQQSMKKAGGGLVIDKQIPVTSDYHLKNKDDIAKRQRRFSVKFKGEHLSSPVIYSVF